jgi:hypothetical protein
MRGKFAALSFLSYLREYVGDRRRRSPRRGARFAARVPAVVSLLEAESEYAAESVQSPSVSGETRDLGPSGLMLRLERVRVGGRYLTDAECYLGVRLELPAGEVALLAKAVRFEQPSEAGGEPGYLLGLRILKVREGDVELYSAYMRTLMPQERRRRELERGRQGSLGWATPGVETVPTEGPLTTEVIARAFENFIGKGGPGGRS